jgi:F0F1-type ATP synthase assembly protein I
MSEQSNTKNQADISRMGSFMALGLVFGGIVGLILDNLVLISGGGMILGLALGTALEKKRQS